MTLPEPRWDDSPDVEARVEALLAQLTLADKIDLVSGLNDLAGQPDQARAGSPLPPLSLADSPAGVRLSGPGTEGLVATALPAPLALAATWDTELARRYGDVLGSEMRACGRNVMLGPAVDIARAPVAGRTFESFGEDPLLQARLVVPEVEAIQAHAVQVCLKHYIVNNQEHLRNSIDVRVDERALRELYRVPFAAAIRAGGAASVMGSYNRINGVFACENPFTLTTLLRDELGFKGWVMSDFLATHSTVDAPLAGLDWELGPRWWGPKLKEAVVRGDVPLAHLDRMVRRILHATIGLGLVERPVAISPIPAERHADVAREIAEQAMVLLKNDGLLPLDPTAIRSIAVIGPDVDDYLTAGGGSAQVVPGRGVSVLDGLRHRLGGGVRVVAAAGVDPVGPGVLLHGPSAIPSAVFRSPSAGADARGLRAEYWANPSFSGEPALTRIDGQIEVNRGFFDIPGLFVAPPRLTPLPPQLGAQISARWTGSLVPPASGTYTLALTSLGSARLWVDERLVIDAPWPGAPGRDIEHLWTGDGAQIRTASLGLTVGVPVSIRVDYAGDLADMFFVHNAQVRLGWLPPAGVALPDIAAAAAIAAECDVAVVVARAFEGESIDRPDIALPNGQDALIAAVAAANPRTVVVLMNAGPVAVAGWEPTVPAIVEAWYAGQEQGAAVARVLFGDVNPGGKLPLTFPRNLSETPLRTPEQYPGVDGAVHYTEGLAVGYRGYDALDIQPQYAFGHGLSYTQFAYRDLDLEIDERAGRPRALVTFTLENVGARAGIEVAQVYLRLPVEAAAPRRLVGWARVALAAGEARRVTVEITGANDEPVWSVWSEEGWRVVAGTYGVEIGASSRDIRLTGALVRGPAVP